MDKTRDRQDGLDGARTDALRGSQRADVKTVESALPTSTSRLESPANSNLTAIPSPPRPVDPLRPLPLGRHRRRPLPLLHPRLRRPGLVHRRIRAGHLPAQPIPRLLAAQVRPVQRGHRQRDGGRLGRVAAHQAGRGVPALHPPAARVQVLAFGHAGCRDRL